MLAKTRLVLQFIFLVLLVTLVLDAGNPIFDKPARDGGFFLYAGSQILSGKIPYLDFWDSKGPAIFYTNALGLFVGQGSRWGVWIVEFIFILASMHLLYNILLKKWGQISALLGVTLAGLGLRVVLGFGNYTEEYPLLFNSMALVLFWETITSEKSKQTWNYLVIGAMFGISFTFRANNIGGILAIAPSIIIFHALKQKFLEAFQKTGLIIIGFLIPILLWTVYFQMLGAAKEMLYASIFFNFSYVSAKSKTLLDYFGGFGRYGMSWYGWAAAFGYLVSGYKIFGKIFRREPVSQFEIFLLLWFPVEIILSNLSGRDFSHYYISWMPGVAIYGAVVFADFASHIFNPKFSQRLDDRLVSGVFVFLILALFVLFPSESKRYWDTFDKLLFNRASGVEYTDPLASYIQSNTQKDDLVLTWYPEMGVNFMAHRTSPVRLVYYPLFLDGTLTADDENSYLKDLFSNHPELIVDCSLSVNAIPSLDPKTREEQFSKPGVKRKMYIHPGMEQVFSFVYENYHKETSIEDCMIFRRNSE